MYIVANTELYHYGILGQKWGIRRYQNSDGSLTDEGKKRYGSVADMRNQVKLEVRERNKQAKELGNTAAALNYAVRASNKSLIRKEKTYEKKPTEKNKNKLDAEKAANKRLKDSYENEAKKAFNDYKSLIDTYGKEAIKNIRFDKDGKIDEKYHSAAELVGIYSLNLLSSITSNFTGVNFQYVPTSNKSIGKSTHDKVYTEEYTKRKKQTDINKALANRRQAFDQSVAERANKFTMETSLRDVTEASRTAALNALPTPWMPFGM